MKLQKNPFFTTQLNLACLIGAFLEASKLKNWRTMEELVVQRFTEDWVTYNWVTKEDKTYWNVNNNVDDFSLLCMHRFLLLVSKINSRLITLRLECKCSLRNCRFWNKKLNCWFLNIFSFQLNFLANMVQALFVLLKLVICSINIRIEW